ncbi:hypothetical protein [Burkholderia aenigmatica]|uniref:hypothetical protein n=1 Tax=Burkholderia aenigmatica TaxID=2015348 RepID=UPI002652E42D|nr:hypothetical protein [Burkholderia aenigmatica]MDN7880054.1 hypothetical protein [Burkholderia aenigmatica]
MNELDLRTDLTTLPGVSDVYRDSERKRLFVSFVDGSTATIERDPLDLFARRDSYIMSLSGQPQDKPEVIFVGRPRTVVIAHIAELAALAATST